MRLHSKPNQTMHMTRHDRPPNENSGGSPAANSSMNTALLYCFGALVLMVSVQKHKLNPMFQMLPPRDLVKSSMNLFKSHSGKRKI